MVVWLAAAAMPAAAQDVIYRAGVAAPGVEQGSVFSLPVPPPVAGGMMIERGIGLLAVEPFNGAEPVAGAPYSADITTDVVQQLADGNRIEHHTSSSVARDGQGRVRREQQLTAIGPILPQMDGRVVTILDPVAHLHYALDPMRKVAMRSPLPAVKRMTMARPALPAGGDNNVRTESLGTSNIEGVPAQGTRTVITVPAGAIGNQAPIEMVTEQWFSPELGVVVMSRRSDPRFGETTYRLQNIVRTEPPAELFQVPSDYTEESLPAFGAGTMVTRPLLP
jgi:hypothetical protein